jgi:hypothetical protein
MKKILAIISLISGIGHSQKNDTMFIFKDSIYGTSQSIFIEKNKSTKFHERLVNTEFGEFDNESYILSLDYLKENKLSLQKKNPVSNETLWIPLVQYQGVFFTYHPCDFYHSYKVSINDTTWIDWTGEGPIANQICFQKKLNKKTCEFELNSIYEPTRKLTIHMIDQKKGIAIFEVVYANEKPFYQLMIAASKINRVPLIVNQCDFRKQRELEFEEPDFIKLRAN